MDDGEPDWSYDTVHNAPDFLSFDGNAESSSAASYGSAGSPNFKAGHSDWQYRGRGGPESFHHYDQPDPHFRYRGPQQDYRGFRHPPPEAHQYYRQPRGYNNRRGRFRGPPPGRYPRFGGRFRGNDHGHGGEVPISAYFHPSMLEDPWTPYEAKKKTQSAQNPQQIRKAGNEDVQDVKADDQELQDILRQQRELSEAEPDAMAGSQQNDQTTNNDNVADHNNGKESGSEFDQTGVTKPK